MTFDTKNLSPTYIGGAAASIGTAILGAPVLYPQMGVEPHWLVVTAILMIVIGTALAHFGAADSKDVTPPPTTIIKP